MIKAFSILLLGTILQTLSAWGLWAGPQHNQFVPAASSAGFVQTIWIPQKERAEAVWLEFPPGLNPTEILLFGDARPTRLLVPTTKLPGLRLAVWKPQGIRAVGIMGAPEGRIAITPRSEISVQDRRPWLFLSPSETRLVLPPWTSYAEPTLALEVSHPSVQPWSAVLRDGARQIRVSLPANTTKWDFVPRTWNMVPTSITLKGAAITQIRFRKIDGVDALPSDPAAFLTAPQELWRTHDAEWYAWQGTSVLVLITSNYSIQARYLKRLAFFVEKTGFRGRLVTDQQVASLHGYNAHDYAPEDLARFFTLAATSGFELHPEEIELRNHLVRAGILIAQGTAAWAPGHGALISVSLGSPPALRHFLFVHEGFHGLYYSSPNFRAGVLAIWRAMPEPARLAFRTYLSRSRYDPSDEPLMINEFQAYSLQQSEAQQRAFFVDRVQAKEWTEALITAAGQIDRLVGQLYGLSSGKVSLVEASRS